MSAVGLVPHRPLWACMFERERVRILGAASSEIVAIEHIGSTAVPGLDAKPVVDMLVGIGDDRAHRPARELLAALLAYSEEGCRPNHAWLTWPSPAIRTFNVHVVTFGGPVWNARLAFRDALRDSRDLQVAYLETKRSLAAAHPGDLNAYTRGKRDFVERVLSTNGVTPERCSSDGATPT